ncbi:MAG: adenylyltransferase/cytidyltransferase family protein [Burkholderiaceae bacterium]|jgi:rfaE bifunctional protein nucleotidyltransferase chain/domain
MTALVPPARFESKILDPSQLEDFAKLCPRPLVFTNGVYDLLHRGHVSLLDAAAQEGKCLILALNSDASVKRLGKGADRPINNQYDRMAVVAALASVDYVTWFEEDTPLACLLRLRPEVLVKGGDWQGSIVGTLEVESWGGRVLAIPFVHERSTTSTLARIRAIHSE